jgi:hypothetical protein
MNKSKIKQQVLDQIELFKNSDGIISSTYPPSKEIISNNLDDLFPFFKYFELESIMQEQINNIVNVHGKFPSKNDIDIPLWSYDEWIGALFLSDNTIHHKIANEILKEVTSDSEKYLKPVYSLNSKRAFDSFSPRTYGIFEVVFENKELIDDCIYNKYIELFKSTLEYVEDFDFLPTMDKGGLNLFSYEFRTKLLNSFHYDKGVKRLVKVLMIQLLDFKFRKTMKESSNFLFSLLEFVKTDKSKIYLYKKFINNIIDIDSVPVKTYANTQIYDLCQSTAIIDNICDFTYFVEKDEKFINYICKLSDFFIEIYQEKGYMTRSRDSDIVFIDEVMDFAIALKRVSAVTKKEKYAIIANEMYHSCKVFYDKDKNTYYSFFDIKTKNKTKIDPKYNFLFLKGIIIFEIDKDKDIYSKDLYALAKDR